MSKYCGNVRDLNLF